VRADGIGILIPVTPFTLKKGRDGGKRLPLPPITRKSGKRRVEGSKASTGTVPKVKATLTAQDVLFGTEVKVPEEGA